MARDARDERTENERRNNNLYQPEKYLAQEAQMLCNPRPVKSNLAAEKHRKQDPIGKKGPAHSGDSEADQAGPTQACLPEVTRKKPGGHNSRREQQGASERDCGERLRMKGNGWRVCRSVGHVSRFRCQNQALPPAA